MRNILRLDEYRGRRVQRFRRTTALYQADPERAKLVRCLGDVCDLLGADRAAILWVDEYGAGLVHVHTLLDLGSDEPRRGFSITPLRKAWEEGVPGLLDFPDMGKAGGVILPEGPRSFCTVALGSDGARSWFLVADSITPRPSLARGRAESLMFLAGECASILLHLDMEDDVPDAEAGSFDRVRRERFSGWPVLQDVDRAAENEALDRR
ncbi:MAG: hypothetical protein GWM92_19420, partial [Gemmatimonadetes bacterium]|nr:hypothetical protein [Gemmatimonadota bacterium]NIR77752.1 hypothetical protein [Gemmatimonadota bacterium]NIT89795.1 hypothetical protein [Gemmatimonadota bacterium]NIU30122.1 hypothetical protein [Gemmatimonadota bacterium]NIU37849.1 hypothetical protein [Gemmatimonadota bacterium]